MLDKIKKIKRAAADRVPTKMSSDRYLVALDIGTEFVKALVARMTDDGAEIIGVGRAHQGLGDMQAGAISDISAVVANCDDALNQAEQQAGVSARTVVIGIAGELVKGTTTTVRCKRVSAEKPLDIEEVEKIIKIVQKRAEEKAISSTPHKHIVVTHGTFTMSETAAFLDEENDYKDKTILLTGSMVPITGFTVSDAGFNLGFAVASFSSLEPGIYISMNGGVFSAAEVKKNVEKFRFE